jgi:tetratricopeptide (TPR) repeat protein
MRLRFVTPVLAIRLLAAQALEPPGVAPRQIDIGAAQAPLSDAERSDLDKAVRRHDYAAEKSVIERATAEHADSFGLLVLWGRLAYLERQPTDAVDALERAQKIQPLSEPDRLTLAIAYQFAEKPAQSRGELLKLVKLAPNNAGYLDLLGRMERVNERVAEAADDFAKAIQTDPSFVRAYEDLGQAQETLGRMEEARKTYEAGAAVNRRLQVHWEWSPLDLGVFVLRAGDYAAAEKLFREALEYRPRFAWGHYYLGEVFHKQGHDGSAVDEYKAAVVDNPRLREAWLALGRELKRQGNGAEADRALAIFKELEDQGNAAKSRKK